MRRDAASKPGVLTQVHFGYTVSEMNDGLDFQSRRTQGSVA